MDHTIPDSKRATAFSIVMARATELPGEHIRINFAGHLPTGHGVDMPMDLARCTFSVILRENLIGKIIPAR